MTVSKRVFATTAVLLLLILGTSCTRRMIDFTVISNKNVMLRQATAEPATRVEGKDQVYFIFWIPLGAPNLEEAVDRAIESAGPGYDALIDGVVYNYAYHFIVSGFMGFRVTGTPVISSQLQVGMLEGNPLLHHSRTGMSNAAALARIPVVEVDEKGQPIASPSKAAVEPAGR